VDVKVINAMLKGFLKVFSEAVNLKVSIQKPEISKDIARDCDVVTIVGFNGSLDGNLVYGFPKDLALDIISSMMGMPYDKLDDLAMSGIGELGNMVSGNIAINLEQIGKPIEITPPSVICGKEIHINVDGVILKIPALVGGKKCEVSMVLRE